MSARTNPNYVQPKGANPIPSDNLIITAARPVHRLRTPPMPASRGEPFQKAIQEYLNKLSHDDKNAFLYAPDVIERLQEMQRDDSSPISSSLTSRVQKVVQCVKHFMSSLGIMIQHNPEITALVVGGVNCIMMLVMGYIEFFDRLAGMMESIGTHLSYLSEYSKPTFQESERLQEVLAGAYCDLLEFYIKVRQVFSNKKAKSSYLQGFKLFFRLTWEPFEAQFGSIEAGFSNHTIAAVRLANVDFQRRALEYQNQALEYQNRVVGLLEKQNRQDEIHRLEEDKRNKEKEYTSEIRRLEEDRKTKHEGYKIRRKILKWLSPDDYEETHERHFGKRFENTGQWLLEESRFEKWRDEAQSSLLWCHGAPGSGKTILASLVIDHLSAQYQLSMDTGMTFIYCNYKESRTIMTYMRLALKQLCRAMQSFPHELQELYKQHYRNDSQPRYDELMRVFLAIIQHFGRIFFVLDALDECTQDQRKDLCKFILSLANSTTNGPSQGVVKLFVTSRKESDIERAFQQESIPTIEVEAAKVNKDIEGYVKAQINMRLQDRSLRLRDMALKDKILSALTTKAGGMFLWVEFQLNAICAEASDAGIERALKRVPDDMDATYERILETINRKPWPMRELARKTLIWTAYARRPLSIADLAYAISIEMGTRDLRDLESSVPSEEFILDACANLVSVDQSNDRIIRFVHFSVQEFLTSDRSTTLSMRYAMAHREIAQTCMLYLSIFPPQRTKLYQYVFTEWPRHLRAGSLNSLLEDDYIVTLTFSFFERRPMLPTEQPEKLGSRGRKEAYLIFSPSVLALIFDLPGMQEGSAFYRTDLEEEQINAIYDHDLGCMVLSDDKLAIHYATAELDSVPVVQRLYKHGYSLNLNYSYYGQLRREVPDWLQLSPLYSAQSAPMARYLLDNGISIEPQELHGSYSSVDPLKHFAQAQEQYRKEIFQLLLNRVVDKGGRRLKDALGAVIELDDLEAVRLLLGKGVDMNTVPVRMRGLVYGNALQAATCHGTIEVIQLLLEKGAEVNAQGGKYGNALQAAAFHGKVKVVELLLDNGADVNAQGGEHGNALQAATVAAKESSGIEIIRLLLCRGADVHAQGGKYGNVLQAAAYEGKIEVVRMLLGKGANINTQGGMFGTVLQAAAYSGNIEVIRLLLDNGADINARGGKYGAILEEMLAFQPISAGVKVPGDIPLLVELLQEHAPVLMEHSPKSEYEDIARGFVNKDRCNLAAFKELLEARGWKSGVQGSRDVGPGRLGIKRGVSRDHNEDWNRNRNEPLQELQQNSVEVPSVRNLKATMREWMPLGVTVLLLLLNTLIRS